MDRHIHIVTHEVPWPANYGGVMSLFYKIKALHEIGYKIHLHCFTSKPNQESILNTYCYSVNFYKRNKNPFYLILSLPYIVYSRRSKNLLQNLEKEEYPILFEGTHCTYWLYKNKLKQRTTIVSLHNIEFEYYNSLSKLEHNIFRKSYYYIESKLLYSYEKNIATKSKFWAVNKVDANHFNKTFKTENADFFPVFVPWNMIKSENGFGNYCFYHANLEIIENEKAALWLLDNIFSTLKIPFVIAGRNPSESLKIAAHKHQHTCIVENPSEYEMDDLIRKAQINIIPSFNNTGVKFKLLNALFNGRHCIVNSQAVEGSGAENLCVVCNKSTPEIQDSRLY